MVASPIDLRRPFLSGRLAVKLQP